MKISPNKVFAAIEKHLGFSSSRCRTIAIRLREEGVWPSGSVGVSPDFEPADIVALIIGLSTGSKLSTVAAVVHEYAALTPGGAVLTDAPKCLPRRAQDTLINMALEAIEGRTIREVNITIVSSWPEIALHWSDGVVQRFQPVGSLSNHWQDGKQRQAVTFSGTAFATVFKELFK